MTPHSDQKYIDALRQQDAKLINEIYAKYSNLVQSIVTSNSGSVSDANDVFQEALVALYHKSLEGFQLEKSFKSYFIAICRYIWLDKLRDKKRKNKKEISFKDVTNPSILGAVSEEFKETLIKEKQYKIFQAKFALLSPHCREIIGLSLLSDEDTGKVVSLRKVAEQMGRDYGYIRKEKSTCLKKLITMIKEDPGYEPY